MSNNTSYVIGAFKISNYRKQLTEASHHGYTVTQCMQLRSTRRKLNPKQQSISL